MLNERAIIEKVLAQYKLPLIEGYHGIDHWARVYQNGMLLAKHYDFTERQKTVVKLFALLHDACRENEDSDPDHGERASALCLNMSAAVRGTFLRADCHEQLLQAMTFHADGQMSEDRVIQVCWDADRLDLDRVGIEPSKELLGIQDDGIISTCRWAGIARACPRRVFTDWGVEITTVRSRVRNLDRLDEVLGGQEP